MPQSREPMDRMEMQMQRDTPEPMSVERLALIRARLKLRSQVLISKGFIWDTARDLMAERDRLAALVAKYRADHQHRPDRTHLCITDAHRCNLCKQVDAQS